MGVFSGPEIVEDGLVLFYDAANASKNASANISTNLITNGNFAGGQGSPQESGSNPTNTIIQMANPGDTGWVLRQNGFYTEYQINLTGLAANTTYVMSGWYAKSSDYSVADTMFHARAYSASGANNATGTDIGTVIYSTVVNGVTWQYCYKTITTPADATGYLEWYVGWGVDNAVGFRYYTNLRMEKGVLPAVRDLSSVGNHCEARNGVTFSSANGGCFSLDGTDDFILTPRVTGTGNSALSQSYCVWVSPNDTDGNILSMASASPQDGWNMPPIAASGSKFRGKFWSNSYLFSTNTYTLNTWYYVCLTFDFTLGAQRLYVNGQLQAEQTGISYSASGVDNYIFFGQQNPGADNAGMFAGRIGAAHVYTNKSLAAQEVVRNFNATRSRYGL